MAKPQIKNKESQTVIIGCSRRHKIIGAFALLGLFICGLMVGIAIKSDENKNISTPDTVQTDDPDRPVCAVIEEMMHGWLYPESSINMDDHNQNIKTYSILLEKGCPENADIYREGIEREQAILSALQTVPNDTTCVEIETLLMPYNQRMQSAYDYIERAQRYTRLSEVGCPENTQKYREMAAHDLEIARAINDDMETSTAEEIIETYKRLNMQAAATDFLNKIKKLTNPAIDFIIEMEKIINE